MSLRAAAPACARWSRASGDEPYRAQLVRWGTELHDRFMLPHFVEQDFRDVLDELARARASRSSASWFAPHFEFRFPRIGARRARRRRARAAPRDRALARARRGAGAPAAPSRYVDSSLERLQVKVRGADRRAPRASTCNGRARAAAPDRHARRVRRRRALPRLAAADGAAPDDPRARAARLRPGRHAGRAARSAAAPTTSRTRAGARYDTLPGQRATRPRRGGSRASPSSATRRARSAGRRRERDPEFPLTLDLRRG